MSGIREQKVASAVKFLRLSNPAPSAEDKLAFLQSKGLTMQECFTAFERTKQRPPDVCKPQQDVSSLTQNIVIPDVMFSLEQLRQYDGTQRPEIYISLTGVVFDVSVAPQFYGPGANYNVYAGREAGRALGKMTLHAQPLQHQHDLDHPWVSDLDSEAQSVLRDWFQKFTQKYPIVGKIDKSQTSHLALSSSSPSSSSSSSSSSSLLSVAIHLPLASDKLPSPHASCVVSECSFVPHVPQSCGPTTVLDTTSPAAETTITAVPATTLTTTSTTSTSTTTSTLTTTSTFTTATTTTDIETELAERDDVEEQAEALAREGALVEGDDEENSENEGENEDGGN